MLLLFWREAGLLSVAASTLTLTVPPATVAHDAAGRTLDATACTLTLSAPVAPLTQVLHATACTLTLTAPPAVPASAGVSSIDATACVLTLTNGPAAVSIDLTATVITIDGIPRSKFIRPFSMSITDNLDEAPNTCTFVCQGFVPLVGQELLVGIGTLTNRQFGGHLTRATQIYEGGDPKNIAYQVEAVDYTRLLDRRLVHQKRYAPQSVTTTVLDLIATFAPGFTASAVATGLPSIAEISFDWEPLSRVLTRLAKLIGAYWYVDYFKAIHFFITETTDPPDAISGPAPRIQSLTRGYDLTQVRTRVYVAGGGSPTMVDTPAGSGLTIPVADGDVFDPAGGRLRSDILELTYSGRVLGGGATVVQGTDGPASPPGAALATAAGLVLGPTAYRVSFKNALGETVPGPASNGVAGVGIPPPGSGPAVGLLPGLGRVVGTNLTYKHSYVTGLGETLVGPASAAVTPAAPSPPGGLGINPTGVLGVLMGAYGYRVTFVTAAGETTGGSIASRTATTHGGPAAPGVAANVANGPLKGTYQWRAAFVMADGREALGPSTGPVVVTATVATAPSISGDGTGNKIDLRVAWLSEWGESDWSGVSTDLNHGAPVVVTPSGLPADATGWIIFSTGSYAASSPGVFFRMPDVYRGSGSGELGNAGVKATAAGGTMGKKAALSLATGPSGTVARRVYRTKAGGSDFFLVAEVANNTTVSLTDALPDTALTRSAPLQNLIGEQHALSAIPTGPAGTIARRLYRTVGGGSEYRRLTELADNTTSTFLDTVPDAALGTDLVPLVNTAGGQNVQLTVFPGPAGTIARRLYRTKTGGASGWFFLGELSDNSTTTFVDDRLDTELGASPALVNTAGASSVQVSSIATGPADITARRLYRLDLAGLYRLVVELKDNTTTTFLDTLEDTALGDVAPAVSTIGAFATATTLRLQSAAPFASGGGWAYLGGQTIRYTGISGTTLTGIPTSGAGALLTSVKAGADVIAADMLLNVSTVPYLLPKGTPLHVLAVQVDAAAQAILAAREGGDGIHEFVIADDLLTYTSIATRAQAELQQFALALETIVLTGRDPKLTSGKTVTVTLGPPTNISGTYKVQTVVLTQFGVPHLLPLRTVTASTVLYSFEHLLRRVELGV